MIIILTVFKYAEDAPVPAQAESRALEEALQAEMIDTGTMLFYHSRLKFFGTEVAGHHWDDAALYAVPNLDAMRRWCMWDKHRAVDLAMAKNNALIAVLPLQFTDSDDPEKLDKFAELLRDMSRDRAEYGFAVDFGVARLGPEYATPGLAEIAAAAHTRG
ncbi:hypothetical protein BJY01DRAFT_209116 [Aspergillus pseudoustus]|uniref:Uncharacterized protein n=1 Tax=Aspergillus pseudoustus TaxID=1810923 RepID=A0ABR4KGV7_9EURO